LLWFYKYFMHNCSYGKHLLNRYFIKMFTQTHPKYLLFWWYTRPNFDSLGKLYYAWEPMLGKSFLACFMPCVMWGPREFFVVMPYNGLGVGTQKLKPNHPIWLLSLSWYSRFWLKSCFLKTAWCKFQNRCC
jgi:hypothetical protein